MKITIYTKEKVYNFKSFNDKNYNFAINHAHREDGSAVILYNDNGNIQFESWYINGKAHRENGPAYINYFENRNIKDKGWYLNDKVYTEIEFNQIMLIKKMQLV